MHILVQNYCLFYRISSRTLLVPFNLPKVGPMDSKQAEAFQQLPYHLKAASAMAGIVVSIETNLKTEGRKEILQSLNPGFFNIVGISNPRVVTGCSILLYFTNKVIHYVQGVNFIKYVTETLCY